ncbi:uncharacterized protein EV422DRAFT_275594 [Fimicolochytrium jonesii]|uniref:uncharacterized protein n=1 Tax=Fimicolochytrium jonesii TaxID=1396493 RepID=UPI0022FDD6D4|nr:uncharacterized protein EV422DRAFT_275594 [Fimicolochytrium jonesii]KAI8816695.1 hypothetical protein EV422DRAFT_275594 [Fimicolochytrium jonesii]
MSGNRPQSPFGAAAAAGAKPAAGLPKSPFASARASISSQSQSRAPGPTHRGSVSSDPYSGVYAAPSPTTTIPEYLRIQPMNPEEAAELERRRSEFEMALQTRATGLARSESTAGPGFRGMSQSPSQSSIGGDVPESGGPGGRGLVPQTPTRALDQQGADAAMQALRMGLMRATSMTSSGSPGMPRSTSGLPASPFVNASGGSSARASMSRPPGTGPISPFAPMQTAPSSVAPSTRASMAMNNPVDGQQRDSTGNAEADSAMHALRTGVSRQSSASSLPPRLSTGPPKLSIPGAASHAHTNPASAFARKHQFGQDEVVQSPAEAGKIFFAEPQKAPHLLPTFTGQGGPPAETPQFYPQGRARAQTLISQTIVKQLSAGMTSPISPPPQSPSSGPPMVDTRSRSGSIRRSMASATSPVTPLQRSNLHNLRSPSEANYSTSTLQPPQTPASATASVRTLLHDPGPSSASIAATPATDAPSPFRPRMVSLVATTLGSAALHSVDAVAVKCFPRSSSGLFPQDLRFDEEEFAAADPKYLLFRRALIQTLQTQINYPLLMPPDLLGVLLEDF